MVDFDKEVTRLRAMLKLHPPGNPNRSMVLRDLAFVLRIRLAQYGSEMDLEDSIDLGRAALELLPPRHPQQSDALNNLATFLHDRFEREGVSRDLEEAITLQRDALGLRPPGHVNRSISLHNLATFLLTRFSREGGSVHLDEAIALGGEGLKLHPPGHPNRDFSLLNQSTYLHARFKIQGSMTDLEDAIAYGRAALELRPPGHAKRPSALFGIASMLDDRFKKKGEMSVLQEAIHLSRAGLEVSTPQHSGRALHFHTLASCLYNRFIKLGEAADLQEAVNLARDALAATLEKNYDRPHFLSMLSLCLSELFRIRSVATSPEGEEAVTLGEAALALSLPGNPDRPSFLYTTAQALYYRFQMLGSIADLEMAIKHARAAIELGSPRRPLHPVYLGVLADCLRDRFGQEGAIADLDEAMALVRTALGLTSPDHPYWPSYLDTLASCQWHKFQRLSVLADLEEAVTLGRVAMELSPAEHCHSAALRKKLATYVQELFRKQNPSTESMKVVTLSRLMLDLSPGEHPIRPVAVSNITSFLRNKSCQQGAASNLDEGSVQLNHADFSLLQPLALCPNGRSGRSIGHTDVEHDVGKTAMVLSPCSGPPRIEQLIGNIAYEILKTLPVRLLNARTGVLCDRVAQLSHFESSNHYKELLSTALFSPSQQSDLIHLTVCDYFQYITLSHRWGKGEPLLRDVEGRSIYNLTGKDGLAKLQNFCKTVLRHGYLWAWSDTCCIDKDSSVELHEAIGSMFSWYRKSALTIVHLSDVTQPDSLFRSAWLTRGWTLQELLAPCAILFYKADWSPYTDRTSSNHKTDSAILDELEKATGIASQYLTCFSPGIENARLRLQWVSTRCTTRPEDIAYSLFGIFNLHLPVLYGEMVENALGRLLAEIISRSGDTSVLDWIGPPSSFNSCVPANIASYATPLSLPPPPSKVEPQSLMLTMRKHWARRDAFKMYRALSRLALPQFINRRLLLPCIVHRVEMIKRKQAEPGTLSDLYQIYASGLKSLEITSSENLQERAEWSTPRLPYVLVRPWGSRLVGTAITNAEQWLSRLEEPFNALLLAELPQNEYKRIATFCRIVAHPIDSGRILQSEISTLTVV